MVQSSIRKSLGFVILNPESDPTALRRTVRTIAENFPECGTLCVVGQQSTDIKENKQYTDVIKGGNTITSLIDAGVRGSKTEWCFIITAGTYLRNYSLRKYEYFQRNDKEILYPVVDRKYAFDEACINGILMPRKAIDEVGPFGDNTRSIQLVKLLWVIQALNKGYKFKALVGARLV